MGAILLAVLLAATPLPESVKVVPPSAEVPPSVAAYSGTWAGTWQGGPEHTLVVEEIEGGKVKLIYSWGAAAQGRKAGFSRATGSVDDKGALRVSLPSGASVIYRYAGDQRLFGEYHRGGTVFRGIFQRR